MHALILLVLFVCPAILYAADAETPSPQNEPRLYDHYLALKHMQESLAGRSLEEQARLQPQINRAERQACQQVRRDREERIPREEYRREGGDPFFVFAKMLEQYCLTLR